MPTVGALALAALIVCAVSGAVVMTGYDTAQPVGSLLELETARAWGWFFRALHGWSAQVLLLLALVHAVGTVARKDDRRMALARWIGMAATLPVLLYLMLGGEALRGDAEGLAVASVMRGLARALPWIGSGLADLFVGPEGDDGRVLLTHHAATATLALLVLVSLHVERLWPKASALGLALTAAGILALARRPALGPLEASAPLEGPWYMGGLRVLLEHLPTLLAVLVPASTLALLAVLPKLGERGARRARWSLAGLFAAYYVLVVVGLLR